MIISIAAQKGGVAKTTTTISLSSYFARNGKKVLVVDIDGQGNASQVLYPEFEALAKEGTIAAMLLDDAELVTYPTKIPNLYIAPSHDDLSEAEQILGRIPAKERRLSMQLEKIGNQFDMIFIDCPPNVNDLPYNALVASDYVIIPFEGDSFSLRGMKLLFKKIEEVKKFFNPGLKLIGLLPTIYDHTTTISKEIYNFLADKFGLFSKGGLVFESKIPKNVDVTTAQTKKMDIFAFKPSSTSALAYKKFAETELIPYLLKNKK